MGGAIYIQNLARAIASLPTVERANIKLSVACSPDNLKLVLPIRSCVDQIYVYGRLYLKIFDKLSNSLFFLPFQLLNPLKINFLYPMQTSVLSRKCPYRWGAWIPDFQHHYFPEFFSQQDINIRNAIHKNMADTAPVIILSSKMAESDFHRLYPHAISRTKVMNFVSYLEPDYFYLNPQLTQVKYNLPDKFFIISNQFWKHKNHALVIEALGILKQNNIYPTIVLTGSFNKNSENFSQLVSRIEKLGLDQQVIILGLISRTEQIQLMRRCLAVIQPSLFEGWSTVIEDARALGKPMLVSDFPVHLEQNPPQAWFFERQNPEQLASMIAEALSNLTPGPDILAENIARQKSYEASLAYGRQFIEIVMNEVSK
ncbi:hypothetical protein BV372_01790 [Nostoc sp. T09]|nr:hypothetical protein BV372_01790 [Nostoc sp. T09]